MKQIVKEEEDPANRNIQVAGGKESKSDSLSRGDWTGNSPLPLGVTKFYYSWIVLGKQTKQGESPVDEIIKSPVTKSKAGHVKSCPKMRGPSRKAKYYLVTDSEPVPWGKGEKNPGRGVKENLKLCAYS